MIKEHEIDAVFDDRTIRCLLAGLKLSADAKPRTDAEQQQRIARFAESVRGAMRCYFVVRAHTNYPAIRAQITNLHRLVVRADDGNEKAVAELKEQLGDVDPATREWLEHCVYRDLAFPSADEIANEKTRPATIRRLHNILCYGGVWIEGRRRQSGRRSQSWKPLLRLPKNTGRRRPPDLAARELVQQLALTFWKQPIGGRPVASIVSGRGRF